MTRRLKRVTIKRDGYPIANYNGHTTDDKHCPRCGSEELCLTSAATSKRRIGICNECGENFMIEPRRVTAAEGGAKP